MSTDQTKETITLFDNEYQVVDYYDGLITIKEFKDYLPQMEEDLYFQLRDDIKTNGMHDPILYCELRGGEKLVLEGHTRLQVAIELKITGDSLKSEPITEPFESINDMKLWMVKHQVQRRNLSPVQKLQLALLSKDTIEEKARENLSKGGREIEVDEHIDTAQEIAKLAGVSRATATRYISVIEKAPEKVTQKLHAGDISIFDAYRRINRTKKTRSNLPDLGTNYTYVTSYKEGKEMVLKGFSRALIVLNNKEYIKDIPHEYRKNYVYMIIEN